MIKLSERAYKEYRHTVTGRDFTTIEEAEKILNRNILLGDVFENKYYDRIYYGCLLIIVNKDWTEITWVKNRTRHKGKPLKHKKKLLNSIMGIR